MKALFDAAVFSVSSNEHFIQDDGAAMQAELKQQDGLTLTIMPCPSGRADCIRVRLTGTDLHAEITSESISSSDNRHRLDAFFTSIAPSEDDSQDWRSETEDLAFSASLDPSFPGFVFLRVYLGSTSDDDCDWQINGSLLVTPAQIEMFAKDLSAF
ncbi:DUF6228 family protein [Pseudomonas pharyngis]|uniref:DUF6228 family protein n=1 Tax=Pseudomonas pharyngis TaxID=2892333 RepID=UPI001F32CED5|nr:DUF6228 family protein [Pseudomonas pharyngis]